MAKISFITVIARRGKRGYYLHIPSKYWDFAEKHHGKHVRVTIEVLE